MHLARLRADDRFDVLLPAPAGLEDRVADGRIPELDELDPGLVDGPHLVRVVESLPPELHRPIVPERRAIAFST